MRGQGIIDVIATGIDVDHHTGQRKTMGGNRRQCIPTDILLQKIRLISLLNFLPAQSLANSVTKLGHVFQQPFNGLFHRPGIIGNNAQVKRRPVFHQQGTVPVKNKSPHRLDALDTDTVIFGHLEIMIPLDDLQIKQSQGQNTKGQKNRYHNAEKTFPEPLIVYVIKVRMDVWRCHRLSDLNTTRTRDG
jgi:hypothetical protein